MLSDVVGGAAEGMAGTPWGLCTTSVLALPSRSQPGEVWALVEVTYPIMPCAECNLRPLTPLLLSWIPCPA